VHVLITAYNKYLQELTREVLKLGFKEETTKINDDAALMMSEFARILTVEAALRAARHASRSKTTHQVDPEDVEKALVHLVKMPCFAPC
jgi:CENP-S associating Centromere protein X